MNGWGVFFIIVVVLLILAAIGWVIFTHLRARRLGLPPPSLNPFASRSRSSHPYASSSSSPGNGIIGWAKSTFASVRNRRTAGGAYEGTSLGDAATTPSSATRGRRGFGPLDPDEAWDARVGNEADVYEPGGYHEEEELGLHGVGGGAGSGGQYSGRGYAAPSTPGFGLGGEADARRGGGSRALDERYDEEMGRGRGGVDPFGDHAERSDMSLRGVSPRPIDTSVGGGGGHQSTRSYGGGDDSPGERRSMFRENM